MKIRTMKSLLFLAVLVSAISSAGCGGGSGSNNSMTIHTTVVVNGLSQDDPGVGVGGSVPTGPLQVPHVDLAHDCGTNPSGHTSFGPTTTDSTGHLTVSDPAIGPNCLWLMNRDSSPKCPVPSFNDQHFVTQNQQLVTLACGTSVNTFQATPSSIDPTNPPATMTITGKNMVATYAMPTVRFYDQSETLYLEVTALSASADGTSLVVPANQVTFSGRFAAVIYVLASDGSWNAVGGADIHVAIPPPPPPTKCKPPMPCD